MHGVESSGIGRRARLSTAAIGASAAAALLVASAAATTSPSARACPTASVVNAALGEKGKTPVATKTAYSKICTYPGSGIVATKITFQMDTASQFATDEKAVSKLGLKPVTVHGVGQAAWTTNAGDLYVWDGHEQIKILAPLTSETKIEALAKKLVL